MGAHHSRHIDIHYHVDRPYGSDINEIAALAQLLISEHFSAAEPKTAVLIESPALDKEREPYAQAGAYHYQTQPPPPYADDGAPREARLLGPARLGAPSWIRHPRTGDAVPRDGRVGRAVAAYAAAEGLPPPAEVPPPAPILTTSNADFDADLDAAVAYEATLEAALERRRRRG